MNNIYYSVKDDELYHFGILGMKWGIRRRLHNFNVNRKRKKSLKKAREYRAEAIKKQKKAAERAKKEDPFGLKNMSDEQLKALNTRMILEKNFAENYTKMHPQKVSLGKRFTESLGKMVAQNCYDVGKDYMKIWMQRGVTALDKQIASKYYTTDGNKKK